MSNEGAKMELTPTQELVAAAKKDHTTTDARGRTFLLRKPGPLAQFRLVEMLGGETSQNQVYVGMVLPLTYIAAMNGEPVTMRTKRELEALIALLDDDGIEAVHGAVAEHFGKIDATEGKEQLKN